MGHLELPYYLGHGILRQICIVFCVFNFGPMGYIFNFFPLLVRAIMYTLTSSSYTYI